VRSGLVKIARSSLSGLMLKNVNVKPCSVTIDSLQRIYMSHTCDSYKLALHLVSGLTRYCCQVLEVATLILAQTQLESLRDNNAMFSHCHSCRISVIIS
jgi:hypothetical protein